MDTQGHVHSFVDTVVAPTCQAPGYTLHRCDCGYEYKDRYTNVVPHRFQIEEQTDATCTQEGSQTLRCSLCGTTKNLQVPVKEHVWSAWNVDTQPTCTESGMQSTHCTTCGKVQTRQIPAKGHAWSAWNVDIQPTCTEPGKQTHTCTTCGVVDTQDVKPLGHKFTDRKKSATQRGMVECFCENCGQTIMQKSVGSKLKKWLIPTGIVAVLLAAILFVIPTFFKTFYHTTMAKVYLELKQYDKSYYQLLDLQRYCEKNCKKDNCQKHRETLQMLDDFYVVRGKITEYRDGEIVGYYKEEYDKKDNVITRQYYDADGNKGINNKASYNEFGDLTESVDYDDEGTQTWKYTYKYTYDDDGNMTTKASYNEDGKQTGYGEYDENGNTTLSIAYGSSGIIIYKYEYSYDDDGNKVSETSYEANGKVEYKIEYSYDDDGNQTGYVKYDKNGNVLGKTKKSFDKNNNLTSVTNYDADDNVTGKRKYTYDKNDVLTSLTYYDAAGNVKEKYKYTNDKDGNRTSETEYNYNEDGELVSKIKYTYDKDGNLTSRTFYNANDEIARKDKYTYDKNGIRTEESRISYEDGVEESSNVWKYQDVEIVYLAHD